MKNLWIAALSAILMLRSDEAALSAWLAAKVFAQSVMPALFPVMALCGFVSTQHKNRLVCASTLMLGLCSGSPAGARLVLLRQGLLTQKQTLFLIGATGTMSPMFFLSTVAGWIGNARASVIILLAHWLSSIVIGLIATALPIPIKKASEPPAVQASLTSALSSAMQALMMVLGAMMLGAVAFTLVRAGIVALFPRIGQTALSPLHALMEIGGGAHAVCLTYEKPYALLCALCSFGGASLNCQSGVYVSELISYKALLLLRAASGIAAYFLCSLFCRLWLI